MPVTAARLGLSPLMLDWSNLNRALAAGLESESELFGSTWKNLKMRFASNEVGFYNAPLRSEISQLKESDTLARQLLTTEKFTDCLFLGIGGSSLGPISLLSSLQEKCSTPIRFHFLENPDPMDWNFTIKHLNPEKTLVCTVTKSGTTFETVSQLLLALEWLGKNRWQSNLVAITDPEKGDLRTFARHNKISTLSIHPSIGGRFSIFSPVGLFPAALAGLSTENFLAGAEQVRDYCEKTPPHKNPLFIIGAEVIRQFPKRSIHVCMPYSTRLRQIGSWFVQLWAESLGKEGKGFTPLAALGATDQHSILQLLRDGPDDKVTFFITVNQVDEPVSIPRNWRTPGLTADLQSFSLMEGHTLHELLEIEYRAISLVLTKRERPHLTFQLDRLDEKALGALYFAHSIMTAFTGTLWGVNPFDQPGVEEGKVYIRQSLNNVIAIDARDRPF